MIWEEYFAIVSGTQWEVVGGLRAGAVIVKAVLEINQKIFMVQLCELFTRLINTIDFKDEWILCADITKGFSYTFN